MQFIVRSAIIWLLFVQAAGVCETYPVVPSVTRRQLAVTRRYELKLTAGVENKVYLPALISFYGATNEQEVTASTFEYTLEPDSVTIEADDFGFPRKYYCLTWKIAPAQPVWVQQNIEMTLRCRNKLYTSAAYPYDSEILERFKAYLTDGPYGKIVVSDEALEAVCEAILQQNPASAETLVEWVCDWVNEQIEFSTSTKECSSEVLRTRKGHCGGMAYLATAILRKLGIPADVVLAKFFNMTGGYHGFMEVYFPDAGWVFYDLSNSQRGFKSPNCLAGAGRNYRVEVAGQSDPRWEYGYFCREEDRMPYKAPTAVFAKPIRLAPSTKTVYGVQVIEKKPPQSVRIRWRPLRDLILDTSVAPGVRPYLP